MRPRTSYATPTGSSSHDSGSIWPFVLPIGAEFAVSRGFGVDGSLPDPGQSGRRRSLRPRARAFGRIVSVNFLRSTGTIAGARPIPPTGKGQDGGPQPAATLSTDGPAARIRVRGADTAGEVAVSTAPTGRSIPENPITRTIGRLVPWALALALGGVAAILFTTLLLPKPAYEPSGELPWPYLAAAFFVAEIAVVRTTIWNRPTSVTLTDIPMVVGFYYVAPAYLMIARLIGSSLAIAIQHRHSPRYASFLLATAMVASAGGVIAFTEVAKVAPSDISGWLVASYAGTFVMVITTSTAAVLYEAVTRRRRERVDGGQRLALGLVMAFINTSFALVAVGFLHTEPTDLWLLGAPAAVGLLGYRAFGAQRSRQARLQFSYDCSQILQVAVLDEAAMTSLLRRIQAMFHVAIVEVMLPAEDGAGGFRRTAMDLDGHTSMESVVSAAAEQRRALLGPAGIGRRLGHDDLGADLGADLGGPDGVIVGVRGANGAIIGTLLVAGRPDDLEPLDEEDIRVLEALGSRLGLVVENSGLVGQLAASEVDVTKLAAIVQTSEDAIAAIDETGRITAWNSAATRLFGYRPDEMLGQVAADVLPDGGDARLRESLAAALAGEPTANVQMEWVRRDGVAVPVAITVSSIRGEEGEIHGASAIVRDETDRRLAEASAVASAEQLRVVIDSSPLGMGTAGPDRRWIQANPALGALLEIQPGEEVGRSVTEMIHPDDTATIGLLEDRLFIGDLVQQSVQRRYVSRSGRVVWAHVTARLMRDSPAGEDLALYALEDITERHNTEERTRITEERFRRAALTISAIQDPSRVIAALLDGARETLRAEYAAFATYSEDGSRIVSMEVSGLDPVVMHARLGHLPSGSGVLGLPGQLGRPIRFRDLRTHPEFGGFPPAHPVMTSLLALPLAHERSGRAVLYVANKIESDEFTEGDEAIAAALATHTAVCLDNARATAQTRELVKDLDRAYGELQEANDAKSRFLATVAHELRAPLHAIVVASELVNDPPLGALSPQQVKDFASTIESSGRHMVRLIDDLADLARIEAGRMEIRLTEIALMDVLAEVAASLAPTARARRITLELPDCQDLQVVADPVRLRQILTNLVENALKFSDRGGRVWVEVSATRASTRVTVHDTGIGIAMPDLERAFLPFEQVSRTSTSGAGLGLAISRSLAELHGGRLDATSVPGSGSSFMLTLPRPTERPGWREPAGAGRHQMVADGAGRSVLIVEDDPVALGLAMDVLRMAGYDVWPTSGLAEARDRLERSTPALILLDLRLGDESGLDLVTYAKAHPRTARVPILVVSADTLPEDVRRAREAGCDVVLSKPLSPRHLLASVHELTQGLAEIG